MATVEIDAIRQVQAQLDEALREIGMNAPAPVGGQSQIEYLQDACQDVKRQILPRGHPFRTVQYDELQRDALETIVPQFLRACVDAAKDPTTVPYGELREIIKVDPRTGYKEHRFIGQDHFTKFMGRPGRRVLSFNTDRGRFDAAGRALR